MHTTAYNYSHKHRQIKLYHKWYYLVPTVLESDKKWAGKPALIFRSGSHGRGRGDKPSSRRGRLDAARLLGRIILDPPIQRLNRSIGRWGLLRSVMRYIENQGTIRPTEV